MDEVGLQTLADRVSELGEKIDKSADKSQQAATLQVKAAADIEHINERITEQDRRNSRMELSLEGIHSQLNTMRLENQRDSLQLEARVITLENESASRRKVQGFLVVAVSGAILKFAGEAVMYIVRKLP